MKGEVQNEGVHAVLAIDPGRTTGVAAGYVELKPTLKETLLVGLMRRKAVEVSGDWREQAAELSVVILNFIFTANVESLLPLNRIHVVVEDFVLRMPATTTDLTSVWVASGAICLADPAVDVTWQQASVAKGFATNDRLRLWKLWEVGSEHKRDAWRHFAARVNKLVT